MNPRVKTVLILGIGSLIMYYPLTKYLLRYFGQGIDSGFLKQLGFFSGPPGTGLSWILGIVVAILYSYFTMKAIPMVREKWTEISWFNLFGIAAVISAAVIEEAFFRRKVMDLVMINGGNEFIQIVVSGLAFGLAHGIWGFLKGSAIIGWRAIQATTVMGLALAVVYVIGERSLSPCIAGHFISAAVIEPWLILSMVSRTAAPAKTQQGNG